MKEYGCAVRWPGEARSVLAAGQKEEKEVRETKEWHGARDERQLEIGRKKRERRLKERKTGALVGGVLAWSACVRRGRKQRGKGMKAEP